MSPSDDASVARFSAPASTELTLNVRVTGPRHSPADLVPALLSSHGCLPIEVFRVAEKTRLPSRRLRRRCCRSEPACRSDAQGRRGGRARSVVVVGRGYYWADPFWYGYGYPFSPYYQFPIGAYPYPGYYRFDPGSAIRLEVSPKEAEVYVDGYYAGVVDDFDGVFQRLSIEPGEHDVTLYRDGLRTVHQRIYLTPRSTFKLKYKMEPLAPGDVAEPRPSQPNPPPDGRPERPRPTRRPRRDAVRPAVDNRRPHRISGAPIPRMARWRFGSSRPTQPF